jgi:hypothetical protein
MKKEQKGQENRTLPSSRAKGKAYGVITGTKFPVLSHVYMISLHFDANPGMWYYSHFTGGNGGAERSCNLLSGI